jgi:hypothetical protein
MSMYICIYNASICRHKIESSAVNLSLKELIDRFAKQRAAVSVTLYVHVLYIYIYVYVLYACMHV